MTNTYELLNFGRKIRDEALYVGPVKERMALFMVYDVICYFTYLAEFKELLIHIPDRTVITNGRKAMVQYWSDQIRANSFDYLHARIQQSQAILVETLEQKYATWKSSFVLPQEDVPVQEQVMAAKRSMTHAIQELEKIESLHKSAVYDIERATAQLIDVKRTTESAIKRANSLAHDLMVYIQAIEYTIQHFTNVDQFTESEVYYGYMTCLTKYKIQPPGCVKTLVRELMEPSPYFVRDANEMRHCRTYLRHPYAKTNANAKPKAKAKTKSKAKAKSIKVETDTHVTMISV